MKQLTSMGIDPSVSATGIVILGESGETHPELLFEQEIKSKFTGMKRVQDIAFKVMGIIHTTKPDRIVIEGYSLGKNMNSTIPLVELGGVLRLMLYLDGLKWFDPRASELKKFVCGKGNGEKAMIMMHVLKRWGHESATNNTADAYGLACMGLAQANRLPGITKEMRALAGAMVAKSV